MPPKNKTQITRARAPFFLTATASSTVRWSTTASRIRRRNLGEFEILPGVPEACAKLKAAGFLLVVATNQPDVGRGTLKQKIVETIHAEMRRNCRSTAWKFVIIPAMAVRLRLPQAEAGHVAARRARTRR